MISKVYNQLLWKHYVHRLLTERDKPYIVTNSFWEDELSNWCRRSHSHWSMLRHNLHTSKIQAATWQCWPISRSAAQPKMRGYVVGSQYHSCIHLLVVTAWDQLKAGSRPIMKCDAVGPKAKSRHTHFIMDDWKFKHQGDHVGSMGINDLHDIPRSSIAVKWITPIDHCWTCMSGEIA